MGAPFYVIRTSSSLWTVMPSLMKFEIVLSSDVFPTLIRDIGNSLKVSAWAALGDSYWDGSLVMYFLLLVTLLVTSTFFVD